MKQAKQTRWVLEGERREGQKRKREKGGGTGNLAFGSRPI